MAALNKNIYKAFNQVLDWIYSCYCSFYLKLDSFRTFFFSTISFFNKIIRLTERKFCAPCLNKETNEIKIKLDKRWDSFPDPEGKRKSFFAGRKSDIDKLKNWIVYSDGGSVLVRGFRGIGKTAFVYRTLSEAYKSSSEISKNVVYVPVNFCGDIDKKNGADYESIILKRLIISLKQNVKGNSEFPGINELYKIAVSSDSEDTEVKKTSYSINFLSKIIFPITLLVFLMVIQPKLSDLIPAIYYYPFSLALSTILFMIFEYKVDHKTRITILLKDPNFLSLKLKELFESTQKIPVFIIDELDKLFQDDQLLENNGKKEINQIIRKLKYLFTLSRARFIFIVHEKYPFWKEEEHQDRPEESTYFNWEVFLTGITLEGIRKYFYQIELQKNLNSQSRRLLEEYIHYISYTSKRVFSEINQTLRDDIKYEKGHPYLILKKLDGEKMRQAVIENILNDVLREEENFENSLSQRDYYHNTYRILRKLAEDIEHNKLFGEKESIDSLINQYTNTNISADQKNPEFVCSLTPSQKTQMKGKIRQFLETLNTNAFPERFKIENKSFFDNKTPNNVLIKSELTFNDVEISELPRELKKGLFPESLEFKKTINEFSNSLNDLKIGLEVDDDIKVASAIFGEKGIALLSGSSLASKIDEKDPFSHNLPEIRKLKGDSPELFRDLEKDPIEWLKNWLRYSLVGSYIENVSIGRNTIGFRILIGSSKIYLFIRRYMGKNNKLQSEINNSLIILLNNVEVKFTGQKINIPIDTNLKGVNNIIKEIEKKIVRDHHFKKPKFIKGVQKNHWAEFININLRNKKSFARKIQITFKATGEYWRLGFLLGQHVKKDGDKPLGSEGFPLIHLHKDTELSNLKITCYSNGKYPANPLAKDLNILANNQIIKVCLTVAPGNIIRMFVNDKQVYNTILDKIKSLNKIAIVAWGDLKPEYKTPELLDYSFEEII